MQHNGAFQSVGSVAYSHLITSCMPIVFTKKMVNGDDFNRLYEVLMANVAVVLVLTGIICIRYERLVVQRTSKKKRKDEKDAAAVRLDESKRQTQQKHEATVLTIVKRLRLARNLRGFARLSRCNPHRLAFQLVDASEQDELHILQKYKRVKRKHSGQFAQRRTSDLERSMRLEEVASRLFLQRAADFRPNATTTLEGRHRVIDELLFFSPPNARLLSQIGYADRGNVVPHPPSRSTSKWSNCQG